MCAGAVSLTSNVDDSFLLVDGKDLGRVSDMVWIPSSQTVLVQLKVYQKVGIPSGAAGLEVPFPINQFPAEPTNQTRVVVLDKESYVQKALHGSISFLRYDNLTYEYLAIRPNPWFRS